MFMRSLILAAGMIAALHAPLAEAKPYRIMMLLYRGATDAEKGFTDYMSRHKVPVEYIIRDAQADGSRVADFVKEARELKPDLIYTFGTTVTAEVVGQLGRVDRDKHITDIPVVFNVVADPVGANLVHDMKSSGRNLTGVSHLVPLPAQLQALQTMRPVQTLGVVYNPQEKNSMLAVQQLEALAPKFNLTLKAVPLRLDTHGKPASDGVVGAMQDLVAQKPQFIYLPSDSYLIKNAYEVVQAAQAARIPVFAATEAPIRNDGALLGLVSTYFNVGELAAHKAMQILTRKVPPARLPVESLNRFTYLVNMRTAKKLGVYPPLSVVKIAEMIGGQDAIDATE